MILVTGSTGNVGRQVVAQLLGAGVAVRALTRNPDTARLPDGVKVVRGDLNTPDSLPSALEGVTSVFLFAVPGSAPAFLAAAQQRGIRRVVFLSSNAVRDDVAQQADPIATFHADIELAIKQSGLQWTFVRPDAFATNALGWAEQIRADSVVRAPYGEATLAPIHEGDIAAVAVLALLSDAHIGATYAITGPQSLTQREQVAILGKALGRDLRFEELSPEVARQQMSQRVPAPIIDALFAIWSKSVGHPALVLPTVEAVTGHPPRSFREWAAEHVADFR